jgi:diguanylate cyclase (GGDEF)-like protein/PAS domain S-box-containing protein
MPHNILLIQRDSVSAKAVRDALVNCDDGPFHIEWVGSCSQGLKRLAQEDASEHLGIHAVGAVLVDLFLPDSRGIVTFDQIFLAAPHIPILVLCASRHESIAKTAVQRGAQDYLLKARFDGYLLPKALRSMLDRATIAEALFEEKERAQVTLNSIGDAVMSSDLRGNVTYLNSVAEYMTGWSREAATGRPVEEVFNTIDAVTRKPVPNPMALATSENKTVSLIPNSVLIRRDGIEAAVEDSAAPVHDRRGRVIGAVMVFHDVSTTRALSLRMSYMAQHDTLTDLPNRAVLSDRLTQAMALANRHRQKLSLLFLDVDNFKSINDTLGHDVGDSLLQSVALRLSACVRSSDTVSRFGGDEFVILLSQVAHAQDAIVCAEKVLLGLSTPHRIGQHNLNLTASVGIVTYPDDGVDVETLLKHADIAMYRPRQVVGTTLSSSSRK